MSKGTDGHLYYSDPVNIMQDEKGASNVRNAKQNKTAV